MTVPGEFGTELVRRTDDPDIGHGRIHAVVTFDGAVDYDGDCHLGNITVDESHMEEVVADIKSRVEGYDVIPFVETDDDSGGD